MEPFVTVTSFWKPWIICRKDFQFRQSKNPGSTSDITIQIMWSYFVTISTFLCCWHSFTFLTLTSLFNCLAYPTTTSFLFSFILIIFDENGSWRESHSGSNKKSRTVTELLFSILKNEIVKVSIFYQRKII